MDKNLIQRVGSGLIYGLLTFLCTTEYGAILINKISPDLVKPHQLFYGLITFFLIVGAYEGVRIMKFQGNLYQWLVPSPTRCMMTNTSLLLVKPREQDEKAVDFLLKLFGQFEILISIKRMEEELGIKASQLINRQRQKVDIEKIESNQKTIDSLKKRLQKLMKNSEEAQLEMFGFDTQTFERISAVQKDLNSFIYQINTMWTNIFFRY